MALVCVRKQAEEQAGKKHSSMAPVPVPASRYLPQVLLPVMDCYLKEDEINPFLPRLHLVLMFITGIEA